MEIRRKIGLMLYVFICTIIVFTSESYGYLDPSAMTYLIQIVSAIFITIGSGIGICLYKIKKILKNRKQTKNNLDNEEVEVDEKQ